MVTLTEVKQKAKEKGIEAEYVYNKARSCIEVIMPDGFKYKSLSDFKKALL
tara:strand:+ start:542 stop:694 length:153 start_codon:yes stop_codon:yes gene_type:complete